MELSANAGSGMQQTSSDDAPCGARFEREDMKRAYGAGVFRGLRAAAKGRCPLETCRL